MQKKYMRAPQNGDSTMCMYETYVYVTRNRVT